MLETWREIFTRGEDCSSDNSFENQESESVFMVSGKSSQTVWRSYTLFFDSPDEVNRRLPRISKLLDHVQREAKGK